MSGVISAVLQLVVVAAGAPLVTGVLRTLKARLAGRPGPPAWQPYADLAKLLRKEMVVSTTTSWVFHATPFVLAATMLVTAAVIPVVVAEPGLAFAGNIVLVMYLLLLGTFWLALAGLDAGSAFGGMGSSRGVAVAALAEPTVILAVLALALRAGTTNLGGVVTRFAAEPLLAVNPGHLLAFASLFIVMIAETGRLPVDNPATHLELTMIHEAMVLEYSGPYLALVEWAGSMKLLVFLSLLANLFVPWGVAAEVAPAAVAWGLVTLAVKLGALAAGLALVESLVAKLRLFRVPELLAVSFTLGLLAVVGTVLVP